MLASTSCNDLAVTVSVSGEIDLLTVPDMQAAVETALSCLLGRELVIDLSETTFFGTRGIHVIEDAVEELERRGDRQPLRLVTDRPPQLRLLGLAGLLHLVAAGR